MVRLCRRMSHFQNLYNVFLMIQLGLWGLAEEDLRSKVTFSLHCIKGTKYSVQLLSPVQFFATPWIAAHQASLSINNSWSLLKLTSIESAMPSNHLILCRPLLGPPWIFPNIRVFSIESVCHIRWPKYWSYSFWSLISVTFIHIHIQNIITTPVTQQLTTY